jgi:hypothetical protein
MKNHRNTYSFLRELGRAQRRRLWEDRKHSFSYVSPQKFARFEAAGQRQYPLGSQMEYLSGGQREYPLRRPWEYPLEFLYKASLRGK